MGISPMVLSPDQPPVYVPSGSSMLLPVLIQPPALIPLLASSPGSHHWPMASLRIISPSQEDTARTTDWFAAAVGWIAAKNSSSRQSKACFHSLVAISASPVTCGNNGASPAEAISANLTDYSLEPCGSSGSCSALLLLDPSCSHMVNVVSSGLGLYLPQLLLARLQVILLLAISALLFGIARVASGNGRGQRQRFESSSSWFTAVGPLLLRHCWSPWPLGGALMARQLLIAVASGHLQAGWADVATAAAQRLITVAVDGMGLLMGGKMAEDGIKALTKAVGPESLLLASIVLFWPSSSVGHFFSAANFVEHVLALFLVVAAAARGSLPAAATSSSQLDAAGLHWTAPLAIELLLLTIGFLSMINASLALLGWVLGILWKAAHFPLSRWVIRRGGLETDGSGSEERKPLKPFQIVFILLAALSTISTLPAFSLLLSTLLLFAELHCNSRDRREEGLTARLWLLLFLIAAAVSLPSLMATAQLNLHALPAPSSLWAQVRAVAGALLLTRSDFNDVLSFFPSMCSSALVHRLALSAGSFRIAASQSFSVVASSYARASLACALLGIRTAGPVVVAAGSLLCLFLNE